MFSFTPGATGPGGRAHDDDCVYIQDSEMPLKTTHLAVLQRANMRSLVPPARAADFGLRWEGAGWAASGPERSG